MTARLSDPEDTRRTRHPNRDRAASRSVLSQFEPARRRWPRSRSQPQRTSTEFEFWRIGQSLGYHLEYEPEGIRVRDLNDQIAWFVYDFRVTHPVTRNIGRFEVSMVRDPRYKQHRINFVREHYGLHIHYIGPTEISQLRRDPSLLHRWMTSTA